MHIRAKANGFEAVDDRGQVIGRIDCSEVREGVVSIDHTIVAPEHQGQGIAAQLVEQVVKQARAEHKRIRPVCSYAYAVFRRNAEYREVIDPDYDL
ncbi:GNAT family N-acetyltransferase [Alicyclobacillus acidiphilus]|uniref:GNAT family N-acetyltransferase n=1 Tax=Alicyclobacillus acidiphilus TaxID=182455 RepID=UPI0008335EF9|nr:GNAT family N-acetyltransferase [Alicyclobacillus acidiphilus]